MRIHFTSRDLANVTVASGAAPMWELLLSLHMLQESEGRSVYGEWRRRAHEAVKPVHLERLRRLTPPWGYSADFLTPSVDSGEFEQALERVLQTPRRVVEPQLERVSDYCRPTTWTYALGAGRARAMSELGEALRAYYEVAIEPYWRTINEQVAAGNGRCGDELGRHGVDQVLSSLGPGVTWEDPVLEVANLNGSDLHLEGRGLRLQFAAFCWRAPTKLLEADATPVLVLPLSHERPLTAATSRRSGREGVDALLGKTRASVLEATIDACSTTTVAHRCRIALGTASYQVRILREGGLVASERSGSTIRHQITPLGLRVLSGR